MIAVSVLVENYRPGPESSLNSREYDDSPETQQIPLHCYGELTSQGHLHSTAARLAIDASGARREKVAFCAPLHNTSNWKILYKRRCDKMLRL